MNPFTFVDRTTPAWAAFVQHLGHDPFTLATPGDQEYTYRMWRAYEAGWRDRSRQVPFTGSL